MLSTLKGSVEFSTGKKIDFNHTFSKGLTAITGPNESGKSIRLEMIRYALFGTKALRSTASSYKSIDVVMEYKIGEIEYKVVRAKSETKLYKGTTPVATGATPVNAAIIKTLGYNMEVFDVANACLQDDITAMTKKTPAERKRMIDKTLGLDALDVLIKETTDKIISAKNKISIVDGQLKNLVVSIPEKPTGYESSGSLENQMKTLISQQQLKAGLIARLDAAKCEVPTEKFEGEVPKEDLDTLLKQQAETKANIFILLNLDKEIQASEEAVKKALPPEKIKEYQDYVDQDIPKQWERYHEYTRLLAKAKEAMYTDNQLLLLELGRNSYQTIEAIETLKKSETLVCPHCSETILLAYEHINNLESSLDENSRVAYNFWVQEGRPEAVTIQLYKSNLGIKKSLKESGEVKQPQVDYFGTTSYVQSLLDMNKVYQEKQLNLDDLIMKREQVQAQINPNIDNLVNAKRAWDKFYNDLLEKEAKHVTYLELKKELEPQIASYGDLDIKISDLFTLISICKDYEMAFSNYQTMSSIEGELLFTKLEAEVELNKQTDIRNALSELKPKVKSYLVPSLSAVASNFLSKMTNNLRNRIDISDEFDITVDGQSVETLSGSGKSVANIAVRLALGTVLTNKIFSVFMADEIDAAMDADRAEFTATCLKELSSVFNQIILISHKKPDADNYIQL